MSENAPDQNTQDTTPTFAELGVDDYPGIYHMVAIPQEDWHLLPDVPAGRDSVNLHEAAEAALAEVVRKAVEISRTDMGRPQ